METSLVCALLAVGNARVDPGFWKGVGSNNYIHKCGRGHAPLMTARVSAARSFISVIVLILLSYFPF